MFKIAICEDDEKYSDYLKKLILKINKEQRRETLFFTFSTGQELLNENEKDWDLIILDIQMAGMDGYEVARILRERDKKVLLVFCSGVYEPTSEAFKVTPYRYLQKRYTNGKMLEEMKEILEEMEIRKTFPYLMCRYGIGADRIRIYADAILYIAIKNEDTQVYPWGEIMDKFPGETFRTGIKMSEICETFNEECGFVRIHNSYTVNMSYIIETHKESVRLLDGTELTISRSRAREFKAVFAKYMAAKYKGK